MSDEDRILMAGCRAGDPQAMRRLVDRYQQSVFGLCFRMLGDRHEAEDVAQEVFVRVFRNLHRWDETRLFRPWLMTIAVNRCRTALGKRARRPVASEFVETRPDNAASPAEGIPMAEELQRALELLREEHRICFTMFYDQQMSCAEIADAMSCTVGTVKTWLFRSRQQLAAELIRRGVVSEVGYELHGR